MLSFFAYGGLETCLNIKKREYIRQEHFVRDPVEMIQRGRERINIRNLEDIGISTARELSMRHMKRYDF